MGQDRHGDTQDGTGTGTRTGTGKRKSILRIELGNRALGHAKANCGSQYCWTGRNIHWLGSRQLDMGNRKKG
ncbi:putative plasma membrane calcium-transporting ATPase 1-like [Sesbania bispinosa]|nr:putative plasma membrane calcium-transporting ATPase 1-like [Sesbania bispinosa]